MATFVWPKTSGLMVKPSTNSFKWIKFGMVGKYYTASAKASRQSHDWSPVFEQLLKVATARTMTFQDVASYALLR
jgi:hypothetical protein